MPEAHHKALPMIIEPLVPAYQALLQHYLATDDALAREAVLLDATELAKSLLPQRVSMDDMLALHQRAQTRLAAQAQASAAGAGPLARIWHGLATGEAMPLMVALLMPQQLDEQQRAQHRWEAEHHKLAAVFEQTDDLVLVFDANGALEYQNPAFERATGWSLAAAQARGAALWPVALPLRNTRHVTGEQPRADGPAFLATWSVTPITDPDGRLLSHVAIGRDITQSQRVQEGERQNDRLRAVATLAAGVAHDFNNLLGSISGLAEVCAAQADAGSQTARNLAGILLASGRAAALVKQLLSFSRELPLALRPVALGALLTRCEGLLAASLPRGVGLQLVLAAGTVVRADAMQIEQVLLNLVKNAGYAMRLQGGTVRVVVDRGVLDNQAPAARVRVIDQGEGIPPAVLPRIFDPFFTTKPVDEGTGLGLSAAHGIAHHHCGELRASRSPGGETVFTLLLPLVVTG